jgi:hypothetical protein
MTKDEINEEELDNDIDLVDEEEIPEPPKKERRVEPARKAEVKPQIKYVAVPRAVPIESMLNEIFDALQRIETKLNNGQ